MAAGPYVYERQSEYWTSRLIEDYFLDLGFDLITLPIPTHIEFVLPADFIFFDKDNTKLFGLQYKALYHNSRDYWPLDSVQHRTLQLYPWIYYSLSEIREIGERRAALHLARFAKPNFLYTKQIYPDGSDRFSDYSRWANFFRNLLRCKVGVRVLSGDHLKELLTAGTDDPRLTRITEQAADVFLVDLASKNAIHYSPFIARLQEVG